MIQSFHGINDIEVIHIEEDAAEIKMTANKSCDFFDGHFEEYKILPAVGQFSILVMLCCECFNIKNFIPKINRMKFVSPVVPETCIRIKLNFNRQKSSVAFLIVSYSDSNKIYSSGSFSVIIKDN